VKDNDGNAIMHQENFLCGKIPSLFLSNSHTLS